MAKAFSDHSAPKSSTAMAIVAIPMMPPMSFLSTKPTARQRVEVNDEAEAVAAA